MMSLMKETYYSQVEDLTVRYADIPYEAILKQDILRVGIRFSKDSLRVASGYKPKDYFIFSFDLVTMEELEQQDRHLLNAPEEVMLFGGEKDLKPTIINVRLNPSSPYQVIVNEGKLVLMADDRNLCEVRFHPIPSYYSSALKSGKKISEIAPVIEWGYLIYLTVYRLCQYWGKDEECQFCDINENYRQQKKAGREYTGVKDFGDILEALEHIYDMDSQSKAITVTGGSITGQLSGQKEVEFYLNYGREIKKRFKNRWLLKAGVEAFDLPELKELKEKGGYDIYHPNFEVWDPEIFKKICPGKERFIGRDLWINRILGASEVFGPESVIPNFVAGVEMSSPFGFKTIDEAMSSNREAFEFFMSKGIVPRFTTWCIEPLAHLKNQKQPRLEYYVALLRLWRDIFEKYQLPVPPGYGAPGVGKAVFSVSAFMDVIRE